MATSGSGASLPRVNILLSLVNEALLISPGIFGHVELRATPKYYYFSGSGYDYLSIDRNNGDIYSPSGNRAIGNINSPNGGAHVVAPGGVARSALTRGEKYNEYYLKLLAGGSPIYNSLFATPLILVVDGINYNWPAFQWLLGKLLKLNVKEFLADGVIHDTMEVCRRLYIIPPESGVYTLPYTVMVYTRLLNMITELPVTLQFDNAQIATELT